MPPDMTMDRTIDNAITGLDAPGWSRRLPDSAPRCGAGVAPPGVAARNEGARDAREPRGCTGNAADRAEPPGAPHAAALAGQGAIASTLDFLGLPALVVDGFGRVLHANRTARPILAGRLRVVDGRLAAGNHRVSLALRSLVMQTAAGQTMSPVAVPQYGRHPLLVYAFPVLDAGPAGRALVVVLDLESRAAPPAAHLRQAFGLTEAQSRVAALIAGGANLNTAADALGISKETARGHLRGVFARTGVRRQPELVALMSRLLPTAALPCRSLQSF